MRSLNVNRPVSVMKFEEAVAINTIQTNVPELSIQQVQIWASAQVSFSAGMLTSGKV